MSWDLSESRDREVKGLLEAMEEFSLEEGVIITSAYEGLEEIIGKTCKIHPIVEVLAVGIKRLCPLELPALFFLSQSQDLDRDNIFRSMLLT